MSQHEIKPDCKTCIANGTVARTCRPDDIDCTMFHRRLQGVLNAHPAVEIVKGGLVYSEMMAKSEICGPDEKARWKQLIFLLDNNHPSLSEGENKWK